MRTRATEAERYLEALGALRSRNSEFRTAAWLKSSFESDVWTTEIGSQRSEIDFRVRLSDGALLTERLHTELLLCLKTFLVLQTHPDVTRGVNYAPGTMNARVGTAVHICEYLLINSDELRLARYGLTAITEADGYRMLKRLAFYSSYDAVYRWTERLSGFLKQQTRDMDRDTLSQAVVATPELARKCPSEDLEFEHDELVRARVWLWANGFYKSQKRADGTAFSVDANRLVPYLYPNGTLKSTWKKATVSELNVFLGPSFFRERPGAPVRGAQRTEYALHGYIKALKVLPMLERSGMPFPKMLVSAASNREYVRQLDMQPPGRFATLPHDVVLTSLRRALEFAIEFGEELLHAYAIAVERASAEDTLVGAYLAAHPIDEILGPRLRTLGTECWSVALQVRSKWSRGVDGISAAEAEAEFFMRFRLGHGLHELIYVFGGAVLLVVGALMARRQGEIIDLMPGEFLDKSGTRLMFAARKSGTQGIRQSLARPIPPIAAEFLLLLQSFQDRLIALGAIPKRTNLLALPKLVGYGLVDLNDGRCNMMLDRFCDFFELPLNKDGLRYYIRQHQLRRFFALLFFWGSSFSGLDTLRWFLGHTDPEHLYHYISESTPGSILRSVKIDYIVERAQDDAPEIRPLLDLIGKRFATQNVRILDSEELGEYIEELLLAGRVSVEPEFFQGSEGKEYRILITVTPL